MSVLVAIGLLAAGLGLVIAGAEAFLDRYPERSTWATPQMPRRLRK